MQMSSYCCIHKHNTKFNTKFNNSIKILKPALKTYSLEDEAVAGSINLTSICSGFKCFLKKYVRCINLFWSMSGRSLDYTRVLSGCGPSANSEYYVDSESCLERGLAVGFPDARWSGPPTAAQDIEGEFELLSFLMQLI